MIEYLASFLAGALMMCTGLIVYLLRRMSKQATKEPRGLEEPTEPGTPPRILPDYVEQAERDADEMPTEPDPDDDDYDAEYIRESKRLDE